MSQGEQLLIPQINNQINQTHWSTTAMSWSMSNCNSHYVINGKGQCEQLLIPKQTVWKYLLYLSRQVGVGLEPLVQATLTVFGNESTVARRDSQDTAKMKTNRSCLWRWGLWNHYLEPPPIPWWQNLGGRTKHTQQQTNNWSHKQHLKVLGSDNRKMPWDVHNKHLKTSKGHPRLS